MDNNICTCLNCELDVYDKSDKCVLHCTKNDTFLGHTNFNESLVTNILIPQVKEHCNEYSTDELTRKCLLDNTDETLFKGIVKLVDISFPAQHSLTDSNLVLYKDLITILNKLLAISFENCSFDSRGLILDSPMCRFKNCRFFNLWSLYNYKLLLAENEQTSIYFKCSFFKELSSPVKWNNKKVLLEQQFSNCTFESISFRNTTFKKQIFNNQDDRVFGYQDRNSNVIDFSDHSEKNITSLIMYNCIIKEKFILNNLYFIKFKLLDVIFQNKSKFEFKNNNIQIFEVQNTNFKALVDCYNTRFKSFHIEKSIFEKFIGFEKCKFGEIKKTIPKLKKREHTAQKITGFEDYDFNKENYSFEGASFHYATFLDFVNFRDAEFYNGLDLRNANFEETPNFLDVDVEPKNTNRETFRIIKHSFDSVGNTIEANKFFTHEMNKERQNLSNKDNLNKKVILSFNYWVSNFGQSWIRPLILIFAMSLLHYFIVKGTFHCIAPSNPLYDSLKWVVDFSNDLADNILPFQKFLKEGMEFISLIFLIIYSTLIYNFVVAVKRIVKR